MVSHAVRLPQSMIEGWASTPPEQLARMVAPLLPARAGQLISDRQVMQGPAREQVALLRIIEAAALGESAGYKLAGSEPANEIRFLTFALDRGQIFNERHRLLLGELCADIRSALDRVSVPLIASESILEQILEEQKSGFICVTPKVPHVVELNQRAYELISAYRERASLKPGLVLVTAFARMAMEKCRQGSGVWRIGHANGGQYIMVEAHHLKKERHAISEDMVLITIKEVVPQKHGALEANQLTPREVDIAQALSETGDSYKEIAAKFAIKEGTMRKHAQNIYRKFDVHSRWELQTHLRRLH